MIKGWEKFNLKNGRGPSAIILFLGGVGKRRDEANNVVDGLVIAYSWRTAVGAFLC